MFKLCGDFLQKFKNKEPNWSSGISKVTFYRTYSRLNEDGDKETFSQVVQRCVEGSFNFLLKEAGTLKKLDSILIKTYNKNAQELAQLMFSYMFDMKFLPPGRGLWMMGTSKSFNGGGVALQNCAFVSTENCYKNERDGLTPFGFLMDVSMLGTGCGFNTSGKNTKLFSPKETVEKITIEDSREGWVSSLDSLIESYLKEGQNKVEFDYSLIRPLGAPIRGFGGVSSGPEPLKDLHENINKFLSRDLNNGGILTSRTIVDIMNSIGSCVVAGNIRRSSLIALGDPQDQDFVTIKDYSLNKNLYRQTIGSYSNNSVIIKNGEITKERISELVDILVSGGDPGYVFIDNLKTFGRINTDDVDLEKIDMDYFAEGTNPCGEQTLQDRELCNLVETFPSKCEDLKEFEEVCKVAYLYAKSVTMAPLHNPVTQKIIEGNRRLGISVSGIVLALSKYGKKEFINSLDHIYKKTLNPLDKKVSNFFGVTPSIKLTTVKPSGTVSLVAGVTAGIHYPMGKYYLKRMRISSSDPLVKWAKDSGYHVEEAIIFKENNEGRWEPQKSDTTSIIEFPIKFNFNVPSRDQVSVKDQHDLVISIQKNWSDNQVSATITYFDEDINEIKDFLYEASSNPLIKSISYLKNNCGDYPQMPESKLTESEYNSIMLNIKEIPLEPYLKNQKEKGENGCSNDTCTL